MPRIVEDKYEGRWVLMCGEDDGGGVGGVDPEIKVARARVLLPVTTQVVTASLMRTEHNLGNQE